jgi:hypothetical protein
MAGSAVEAGMVSVEKKTGEQRCGGAGEIFFHERLSFLWRLRAESFEGSALKMAYKLGRLLAVQLRRIELAEIENVGDGVERGVDEDTDE